MIKTHPKSKIYRIKEADLIDLDGVIIQLEHIAQPIRDNYHCFIEIVPKEDYTAEPEHKKELTETQKILNDLRRRHENLCMFILSAFDNPENPETAEIKVRGFLTDALNMAEDWLT